MKIAVLLINLLFSFDCFVLADDFLETIQLPGNECFSSITALRSGDIMASSVDYTSSDVLLFKFNDSGSIQRAQFVQWL